MTVGTVSELYTDAVFMQTSGRRYITQLTGVNTTTSKKSILGHLTLKFDMVTRAFIK